MDHSRSTSTAATTRPWLVVCLIALAAFVIITTEFLPVGVLESIAADMRVPIGTAGLLVTIPGFTAAIAAPFVTMFIGKTDRKTLLTSFVLLVMVSNLAMAVAHTFTTLLAARFLLGIGVGGFGYLP